MSGKYDYSGGGYGLNEAMKKSREHIESILDDFDKRVLVPVFDDVLQRPGWMKVVKFITDDANSKHAIKTVSPHNRLVLVHAFAYTDPALLGRKAVHAQIELRPRDDNSKSLQFYFVSKLGDTILVAANLTIENTSDIDSFVKQVFKSTEQELEVRMGHKRQISLKLG